MKRIACCGLIVFLLAPALPGAELTQESLTHGLRKQAAAFEEVGPIVPGRPLSLKIALGAGPARIDGEEFDGFRFKMPEGAGGEDFVWYFNVPNEWAHWYILPLEGAFKHGFKNWLDADKVYEQFDPDPAKESGRRRVLQTLNADYFQAGREYLIWFRRARAGGDGELRGVMAFAKPAEEWDAAQFERVLGLKPQPAAAQVAGLRSRGGQMLLDEKFFDRSYADERIDSVFFSLRQTKFLRDGHFLTIETKIPPCTTTPPFGPIQEKWGEPDFSITSHETAKLHPGRGENDDPETVTYYYDHFGFEVEANDPKQRVRRVVTTAADFSKLKPQDDKSRHARVPLKNLTCFYKDKKEIGRIYHLLEGAVEPVVIQEPPKGIYLGEEENLEYHGDGKWTATARHEDGKTARTLRLEGHRLNGRAEGTYSDGRKSFTAHYKDGKLDGEVVEYSEDGTTRRRVYQDGKRVE